MALSEDEVELLRNTYEQNGYNASATAIALQQIGYSYSITRVLRYAKKNGWKIRSRGGNHSRASRDEDITKKLNQPLSAAQIKRTVGIRFHLESRYALSGPVG